MIFVDPVVRGLNTPELLMVATVVFELLHEDADEPLKVIALPPKQTELLPVIFDGNALTVSVSFDVQPLLFV